MFYFPPEFDASIYLARNPDLSIMTRDQAVEHYAIFGSKEGRICSMVSARSQFLALVPKTAALLEIGPYTAPAFRQPEHNVQYLDAFSTEELRIKATAIGLDASGVPEIDYVWHSEPYINLVRKRMDAVFSSHNIEHQPDLIRHLREVGNILNHGGYAFLIVPDRRYCFDYFLPDTTIADVFGSYYAGQTRHNAASIFEHRMLTTHNDAVRHWKSDHGATPLANGATSDVLAMIDETFKRIKDSQGYIDTHAWQFTPSSFRLITDILSKLRLIPFQLEKIYPTLRDDFEFYVVLRRIPDA